MCIETNEEYLIMLMLFFIAYDIRQFINIWRFLLCTYNHLPFFYFLLFLSFIYTFIYISLFALSFIFSTTISTISMIDSPVNSFSIQFDMVFVIVSKIDLIGTSFHCLICFTPPTFLSTDHFLTRLLVGFGLKF